MFLPELTHFTEEGNISILTRNECIANNLGYDEGSNDCGNHSSCDRNCINLNDEHLNESDNARHDVDLPKASFRGSCLLSEFQSYERIFKNQANP